MVNQRARVGIIGTGWWSTFTHLPGLLANDSAEVVALCDADPDRLARASQAFPGPATYVDVDAMLAAERLDGAIVAVTHAAHFPVASRCLDAGLHVLLEKPMTLTARDARALLDHAAQKGREVIVGYPWPFTRTALRAREVITSGELGAPQFVQCTFASMVIEFLRGNPDAYQSVFPWKVHGPGQVYKDPSQSGGGQGHLQITHSSGLMFFMTGLRAEHVSACMNNYGLALDLVDAMAVRFEGGAVGIVGATGNLAAGDSGQLDVNVYCEEGYVLLDAVNGRLTIKRHDGSSESDLLDDQPSDITYPRFDTSANLVDVCLGRAANGAPGEVGLRSVELLDAAYRSAADGARPVTIAELYG